MKTYNIYRNGLLFSKDANHLRVTAVTGIRPMYISNYVKNGISKNGYTLQESETVQGRIYEKGETQWWTPEDTIRWEEVRVAAFLRKRGLKAVRA